jgi:hypothetical protein
MASAGSNSQCHTEVSSDAGDVHFLCWPVVSLGVRSYVGDYVEMGIYQTASRPGQVHKLSIQSFVGIPAMVECHAPIFVHYSDVEKRDLEE